MATEMPLHQRTSLPPGGARRSATCDICRLRAACPGSRATTAPRPGIRRWLRRHCAGESRFLISSITEIKSDGPHYRGHAAIALAA